MPAHHLFKQNYQSIIQSFVIPSLLLSIVLQDSTACAADSANSEKAKLSVQTLADGFYHPWGMSFISDHEIILTERSGDMYLFDMKSQTRTRIEGLPIIEEYGQGGLLDVLADPDFANNKMLYFSYSGTDDKGFGTEVARAKLENNTLKDLKVLFKLLPKTGRGHHFGSRLVFDPQGHLYITLGDRGSQNRAQNLNDHAGSVVRINKDGSIPEGNPFVSQASVKPEIYSYGHRNIQGAALHPVTGKLWTHEHGPQGGDEINIPQPGKNYGWPVITYGVNYGLGAKIGEGTAKPGMEQPIYYWVPSIAPSGMAFYTGDKFPQWQNNLLVGSLKFRLLVRLELDGNKVVREERLLKNRLGRIRDIEVGPDGFIYILTDENNGKLFRLGPAS